MLRRYIVARPFGLDAHSQLSRGKRTGDAEVKLQVVLIDFFLFEALLCFTRFPSFSHSFSRWEGASLDNSQVMQAKLEDVRWL